MDGLVAAADLSWDERRGRLKDGSLRRVPHGVYATTPRPADREPGWRSLAVLNGQASTAAAAIRRKATCLHLNPRPRDNADRYANYPLAKRDYLNYPQALQQR